ncbi:MAG TPA: anti-sigma factor [Thermoanaerobaculia bacterium]|jgi:anti-sigma factor RsiW
MSDLNCKRFILECLIEYEDGTMPADERALFEQHMELCPPCLRFLTSYRATGKTLKLLKPEEIPPDLAQSVLAFVRSRAGRKA